MERVIMAVITMTCILLSGLLIPSCASLHIDQLHYSSSKQAATNKLVDAFPRKLIRINEEVGVAGRAVSDSKSNNKLKEDVLGDKNQNKEQKLAVAVLQGSKGTWQERSMSSMERNNDESDFFTMDYSRVRRRRPIHNKSVPVRLP